MAQAPAARSADVPEQTPPFPAAAARFVRADHLEPGYVAGRHIALTLTLAGLIAAGGALMATRARPIDWLVAPAFFIVANFIEWAVHRYPMHHPMTPRILYKNHTLIHHIAFTDRNMPVARSAELGLVMMPWYTMLGLFTVASPVMIVAGVLRGIGLAGVFLLAAVAYFLMYEVLHASYHLPDAVLNRVGVGRLRLFRAAQAHHRHHHVLSRMTNVNFNVTFPLMDRLLGTLEKAPSPAETTTPAT
jgi:sterol desaturase/sphingolipid hydroxylase (fatty acid hydroxylase superfamily)